MIEVAALKQKFADSSKPQSSAPASGSSDPPAKKRMLENDPAVEDDGGNKKSKVDCEDAADSEDKVISAGNPQSRCRPAAFGQPREPASVLKPSGQSIVAQGAEDDELQVDSDEEDKEM